MSTKALLRGGLDGLIKGTNKLDQKREQRKKRRELEQARLFKEQAKQEERDYNFANTEYWYERKLKDGLGLDKIKQEREEAKAEEASKRKITSSKTIAQDKAKIELETYEKKKAIDAKKGLKAETLPQMRTAKNYYQKAIDEILYDPRLKTKKDIKDLSPEEQVTVLTYLEKVNDLSTQIDKKSGIPDKIKLDPSVYEIKGH